MILGTDALLIAVYACPHCNPHCNTLQHNTTRCHTYSDYLSLYVRMHSSLQHIATHFNTLQHTATHCNTYSDYLSLYVRMSSSHKATIQHCICMCNPQCKPLNHTATHCNTYSDYLSLYVRVQSSLQHTETQCNTLQRTTTHSYALHHIQRLLVTICVHVILTHSDYSAPHVRVKSSLQHTATHCNTLQGVGAMN